MVSFQRFQVGELVEKSWMNTNDDNLYILSLSLSFSLSHTDTSYGSKEKEKQTKKIIIQRKEILREREWEPRKK